MRLALLADLHSNREGLLACLAHARQEGIDRAAFIGDLIGYGGDPLAVLGIVRERVAQGDLAVRGNHDAAILDDGADSMNRAAEAAIGWTREQLGPEERSFLAGLPLTAKLDDGAEGAMGSAADPGLLVHSSADRPADWTYVTDPSRAEQSLRATSARFVFSGHVHEQAFYYPGPNGWPIRFRPTPGVAIPVPGHRRFLAIVGAAGQPRDGNTAAAYALLDTGRRTLTFHRVPYEWQKAAARIRAAGLPEALALRLERGG